MRKSVRYTAAAVAVSLTATSAAEARGWKLKKIGGWVGRTWEHNKRQMPFIIGATAIGAACIASGGAGCSLTVTAPASTF
jgi:hypothetical protein